ncbi:MAG: Tat pathway signal protein [Sphingomonadales bacterium]|nr:Tat pathway signal protein [Sphingomonadales bacterium]
MRRALASLMAIALVGCGRMGGGLAQTGAPVVTQPSAVELAAFEADLEQRTFRYFWETHGDNRCLVPDRYPAHTFSSIAATGFALTAYGIGAERGYVSRADAAVRVRDCLRFYWNAPQGDAASGTTGYKGFFYHFLKYEDGTRFKTVELSTVDTTLLMGGVLFAQGYFDRDDPVEAEIRDLGEKLYARIDWAWAQRTQTGTQAANLANSHGIVMGWSPESGFQTHDWVGYNEGMLIYVLAAGSPTYPVGQDAWDHGWAARLGSEWGTYNGQEHLQFEPLFGHQYSHVWIDFRGIGDPFIRSHGIDYFENSRRATLAQQGYGRANSNAWKSYSDSVWGWTASDGPGDFKGIYSVNGKARTFMSYAARGASGIRVVDDGTVVPTAAGGSIPFAPTETLTALYTMCEIWGNRLYTPYGFKDAFNPSFTFVGAKVDAGTIDPKLGWVDGDYLGIDQGPIIAMIENHRSGLVWSVMRRNQHIKAGLKRLGFTGGWLDQPQSTSALLAMTWL